MTTKEINYNHQDLSLSRWCAARWISILVEKHVWLSAGLMWLPEASDTGRKPKAEDWSAGQSDSVPRINIFEHWEEGAQVPRSSCNAADEKAEALGDACASCLLRNLFL